MINDKDLYYFNDEIDIDSLINNYTFLHVLIIYKFSSKETISYLFNNHKFSIKEMNGDQKPGDDIENAIIINGEKSDGGEYNELYTAFLNSKIQGDQDECAIYINENKRTIQIIGLNHSKIRFSNMSMIICMMLPKLMPWYFENLDYDMRYEIVRHLVDYDYKQIEDVYENIIEEKGIKQEILKREFLKINERITGERVQTLENHNHTLVDDINLYLRQIADHNRKIRENNEIIMGIRNSIDNSLSEEMLEFLDVTNHEVELDDINGSMVTFSIRTVLDQVDRGDVYNQNILSYSYLYDLILRYCKYTPDEIKAALRKIFEDDKYKLWCSTKITVDILHGYLDIVGFNNLEKSMPHPHLNTYLKCFGNAAGIIAQYISEFRYSEALAQIYYASKQFTLQDGAAGEKFVDYAVEYNCIECPDGVFRNMIDFINYLKQQEETDDECQD